MKDPTSTKRHSSRQTSTQPPTIPQRSANMTTSPIPPRRHAGPTTTATTAETRPTRGSPKPPCQRPKRTPSQCHGDITVPTWTETFLRARPSVRHRPSTPPPQSLPHGGVCVFKGITGTFHQEMWVWTTRPWCIRGATSWGGVCYCKGYSSVNSELHVGTWWKTSAGQLMALDRMLWPEHLEQLQFWRQTWAEPYKNIYYIPLDLGHHFTPFYYEPHSQPVMNSESIDNKSTENKQCIWLCPAWCAAREQQQRSKLIKAD